MKRSFVFKIQDTEKIQSKQNICDDFNGTRQQNNACIYIQLLYNYVYRY